MLLTMSWWKGFHHISISAMMMEIYRPKKWKQKKWESKKWNQKIGFGQIWNTSGLLLWRLNVTLKKR